MVDTNIFLRKEKEEVKAEVKEKEIITSRIVRLFRGIDEIDKLWNEIIEAAKRDGAEEIDYAWLTNRPTTRPKLRKLRSEIINLKNIYPRLDVARIILLFDYDNTIGAVKNPMDPVNWYNASLHELSNLRLNSFIIALEDMKSKCALIFAKWNSRFAKAESYYARSYYIGHLDMGKYNRRMDELGRIRSILLSHIEQAKQQIKENPEAAYAILPAIEKEYNQKMTEALKYAGEIRESIMSSVKVIHYMGILKEQLTQDKRDFETFYEANKDILPQIKEKLSKESSVFLDKFPEILGRYLSIIEGIREKESLEYGDKIELGKLGVKPADDFYKYLANIQEAAGILTNKLNEIISQCEDIAAKIKSEKTAHEDRLNKLFLRAESFRTKLNQEGAKREKLSPEGEKLLQDIEIYINLIFHLHAGKEAYQYDAADRLKIGLRPDISTYEAIDFLDKNFDAKTAALLEHAKTARKTEEIATHKKETFKEKVNRLYNETKAGGIFDNFVRTFANLNKDLLNELNKHFPKKITYFLSKRASIVLLLERLTKNQILPMPALNDLDINSYGNLTENTVAKIELLFNLEEFKSLLDGVAYSIRTGKKLPLAA